MSLLKALPELEPQIQDGSLTLCVASKTQSFFRKEDQRLRERGNARLTVSARREVVQGMLGVSTRECERKLAELSPASALPSDCTREFTAEKVLVQFVADRPLLEKLDRLKALFAHKNPEGSYGALIEQLADLALKN